MPVKLISSVCLAAACLLVLAQPVPAQEPELWLAPTVDAPGRGPDFPRLFEEPNLWPDVAKRTSNLSIPVNYLLRSPASAVRHDLDWLRAHHIPLDVGVPILTVDKHVCGDGVEGMIWPGEAALMAHKLQNLGVDVTSFSLDLPLSDAHLTKDKRACHLSIDEVALRVAASVQELRRFYPHAKIIDTEVPTGISTGEWSTSLTEWLTDYHRASGTDFDAVILDVWWAFSWQDTARASVRILRDRHIRSGIILDADGNSSMPAAEWIGLARQNGCAVRRLGFDIVGVANWMDMQVHNLPESNPNTLTGLARWFWAAGAC